MIVEKFPQLPSPPQDIIIERWLEYPERLRRVVYQPAPPLIPQPPPKNVHIIWDAPAVSIRREFRNLGIVVANPSQYAAQHGASLVHASQIPPIAPQVRPNSGEALAIESPPRPPRLVGDVQALGLVSRHRNFPAYETPYTSFSAAASPSAASALNFRSFGSGIASAPSFNLFAPLAAVSAAALNSGYLNNGSFESGSAFTSGKFPAYVTHYTPFGSQYANSAAASTILSAAVAASFPGSASFPSDVSSFPVSTLFAAPASF